MSERNGQQGFNFVRWSVDHPHSVLAFFLATLVLGYLAITQWMPKRFMPYIETPMIGIVTDMPGLSAEEMETYFSSPIEQKMVSIQNVRYIRSTSQDGFSMVVLEFPYGSDMRQFTARGIPCVMFVPTGLELAHAVDERVSIDDLAELARIYVRALLTPGSAA